MQSRYDSREAAEYVRNYAARAGEELALRVYTSRLLGAEPSLVLHGGGNTSVKSRACDVTGEDVAVLYVKGSGWDLASIEPKGFPACRLEPLRRMAALEQLSDEDMVKGLCSQMLDPSSPKPSVEALLHAFIPARFIDHTHANAVLAVVDQPDSARRAQDVWGDGLLFVPYVMPGFLLARRVVELGAKLSSARVMVLDKHGIFTWGQSAQESYERMIESVTLAERYLSKQGARAVVSETIAPAEPGERDQRRRAAQRRISPILRGALARALDGQRLLIEWRDEPPILELLARPDAESQVRIGPITPDHVIRTKPAPLWLGRVGDEVVDTLATRELTSLIEAALSEYAQAYEAYFERGQRTQGRKLARLDRLPRLVVVPGLGAAALGKSVADARITGDIYAHTARVLLDALRIGSYRPVSEAELFEVEYWSLEQAKLSLAKGAAGPLDRRIALVTGAASGIGLATASHLLELGAHVVLSDVHSERLAGALETLKKYADKAVACVADVRSDSEVSALFEFCIQKFGGVDVVVSNAGTAPSGLLHEAAGDHALRDSLEINLLAHQRVARAAANLFIEQGIGGCLLFNASKSAFNPGPEFGPYAVAKAAVVALMRQYAIDLGRHGVRANAVNADRIRTELFAGGVLEARAKARGLHPDEYFRQNLLARETSAQDVARAFGYLATAEATTGAVITVDGGNAAAFPR